MQAGNKTHYITIRQRRTCPSSCAHTAYIAQLPQTHKHTHTHKMKSVIKSHKNNTASMYRIQSTVVFNII